MEDAMVQIVTRISIGYSHYPTLQVHWKPEEDGHGWRGEAKIWEDGNTARPSARRDGKPHEICVRQTIPIGHISISIDSAPYCSRAWLSFEGTTLTERDLMWATGWAISVLKDCKPPEKPAVPPACAMNLVQLIFHFRMAQSIDDKKVIAEEYQAELIRLIQSGKLTESLPPEDMLPDEYMPAEYWNFLKTPAANEK